MTDDAVNRHNARILISIYKAVEERHELLPYMKKLLISKIVENFDALTDEEIDKTYRIIFPKEEIDAKAEEKG